MDVNFDFRSDSAGLDPDFASPTLKKYHRILWNKELPNGDFLEISEDSNYPYLLGRTSKHVMSLTSDTICNSYVKRDKMKPIVAPIIEEVEYFRNLVYSIGGFTLFPGNQIDGKLTINQERGWSRKIDDRFDLTLDCIRCFYQGEPSPLSPTLQRYSEFFEIFVDFPSYVRFFFFEDLVTSDFSEIRFFMPRVSSQPNYVIPRTTIEYSQFMVNAKAFLKMRNTRIEKWAKTELM